VIYEIDGQQISSINDISQIHSKYQIADKVDVNIIRGGEKMEITLTLEQRP